MRLKDTIEIMRPINDIIGSLTVIIGILNTRNSSPLTYLPLNLILGILTYFFLAGSGMIINDIYDLPIDKINRPERPIPSGRINLKQAKILFIATYAIGVILALIHNLILSLGIINIILAAFFGFIGWVYAKWGKKSGFPGNIIVGISFSIGLIYGAVLNGAAIPAYIYYFFLTSFFLLIAREIVKGCEDVEGDKEEGVKTLAITIGIKKSLLISIICQVLAVIFFILPLFAGIINPTLFIITMSLALAIITVSLYLSFSSKLKMEEFKKISLLLKVAALFGLVAFIFASI